MNPVTKTNDSSRNRQLAYYALQDRDGGYVKSVDTTDQATTKLYFTFTSDLREAFLFSYEDLYSKHASNALGVVYAAGFSGGRAIRLDLATLASLRKK